MMVEFAQLKSQQNYQILVTTCNILPGLLYKNHGLNIQAICDVNLGLFYI